MFAREDMLELTRRMTPERTSIHRIAGAYMDKDGFCDGSFNTSFLKLKADEKKEKLAIAKAIPFAPCGTMLQEYYYPKALQKPDGMWMLLQALLDCSLKNDALLDTFYEVVGEHYQSDHDYCILFFHDVYDLPAKGRDKEWQWESDESFTYMICAICPLESGYRPGKPECGFLYPAFENRAARLDYLAVFNAGEDGHPELTEDILQCAGNYL